MCVAVSYSSAADADAMASRITACVSSFLVISSQVFPFRLVRSCGTPLFSMTLTASAWRGVRPQHARCSTKRNQANNTVCKELVEMHPHYYMSLYAETMELT